MSRKVELRPGKVWLPLDAHVAPRQIAYCFLDANNEPYVRWCWPGFPDRGGAMTERSFRGWIDLRCAVQA